MTEFLIYLFETGVCLAILYLAYWLFLRNETWFHFTRFFLAGSFIIILAVPLLHINLNIIEGSNAVEPATGIVRFRTYYEELIRTTNADFGTEPGSEHSGNPGLSAGTGIKGIDWAQVKSKGSDFTESSSAINNNRRFFRHDFSLAFLLLVIYIGGVVFFLARFLYLVIRLWLLVKRNGVTQHDGFRLVEIRDEISPFSFFRFLFINHSSFNDVEIGNVLAHEKAHIRQRHSIDHLFLHALAVFQWFNPFSWQLSRALKTTHEYIADRYVLENGFEAFDYQSLLLRQLLGYHSVSLVNNFNLKPIKKRIAMMNKKRSGKGAMLKALLVIPFTIFVFFLFADFTLVGPENRKFELKKFMSEQKLKSSLDGLWVKTSNDDFSDLILFTKNVFSFTEGEQVRNFFWSAEDGKLFVKTSENAEAVSMKFELKGNRMILWWNDYLSSSYEKTAVANTADLYIGKQGLKLELPYISQYRLMENQKYVNRICLGYSTDGAVKIAFNEKQIGLSQLEEEIRFSRNKKGIKLDAPLMTNIFYIDTKMPMKEVSKIRSELRRINSLKFADAGYPHGEEHSISALLYHNVALPRLLPPPDAKELDIKELEKKGISPYIIDLAARNLNPADISSSLHDYIKNSKDNKYLMLLSYDSDIPYGQYIEVVDMIYNVIYGFRNELSLKKYGIPYADLGDELQKGIRKAYPIMLSEKSDS